MSSNIVMESALPHPDRVIYRGQLLSVGLFRCPVGHPLFEDSGPIQEYIIVFPRTSVSITHAGREPVIASPNTVMFYNQGQVYRRGLISERGDVCEWFAYPLEVIISALSPYDHQIERHVERPFKFTHGPSDSSTYMMQRLVVEHLLAKEQPDRLFVEETLLGVLSRAVTNAFRRSQQAGAANPAHRELARAVKKLLLTNFREPLTIEEIAHRLHYSPYHLCRIFAQQTGFTIHQYLTQIRLRTALEQIADGGANLAELAFDLGFSSHSHFTLAFRRAFGAPPTRIREIPISRRLPQLSKNLIA